MVTATGHHGAGCDERWDLRAAPQGVGNAIKAQSSRGQRVEAILRKYVEVCICRNFVKFVKSPWSFYRCLRRCERNSLTPIANPMAETTTATTTVIQSQTGWASRVTGSALTPWPQRKVPRYATPIAQSITAALQASMNISARSGCRAQNLSPLPVYIRVSPASATRPAACSSGSYCGCCPSSFRPASTLPALGRLAGSLLWLLLRHGGNSTTRPVIVVDGGKIRRCADRAGNLSDLLGLCRKRGQCEASWPSLLESPVHHTAEPSARARTSTGLRKGCPGRRWRKCQTREAWNLVSLTVVCGFDPRPPHVFVKAF